MPTRKRSGAQRSDASQIFEITGVDSAIVKAICDNLELGLPLDLAAEAEGVPRRTVRDWVEQFREFSEQITRARALGEINLHRKALEGGPGSSQATWILERCFREHYGPPSLEADKSEVKIKIVGGLPTRPR